MAADSLLGKNGTIVIVAANYANQRKGEGGPVQRPIVQPIDIERWDQEKRPAVHFT